MLDISQLFHHQKLWLINKYPQIFLKSSSLWDTHFITLFSRHYRYICVNTQARLLTPVMPCGFTCNWSKNHVILFWVWCIILMIMYQVSSMWRWWCKLQTETEPEQLKVELLCWGYWLSLSSATSLGGPGSERQLWQTSAEPRLSFRSRNNSTHLLGPLLIFNISERVNYKPGPDNYILQRRATRDTWQVRGHT